MYRKGVKIIKNLFRIYIKNEDQESLYIRRVRINWIVFS